MISRATPRKLGPAPARSRHAREEYRRQLDELVALDELAVEVRDFLDAVTYAYSDVTAKDFYPSQATMSELRRCSRRTIQRRVAAAKAAGVLLSAQLKGYDPATRSWYCSTNTYRPTFLEAFLERQRARRASRRAEAREARIAKRAPRRGSLERPAPVIPPVDEGELERVRAQALPVAQVAQRAQALRDQLRHPPPDSP